MGVLLSNSNRLVACILSLLIPGWGQIYLGRTALAVAFQVVILSAGIGLCWSRLILHPEVFLLLGIIILAIHLTSVVSCWIASEKNQVRKITDMIAIVVFPVLFASLALSFYYYRENWLGVGLYQIPTQSMQPSIQPGDIVIVDTWAYRDSVASIGDVILFVKPTTGKNLLLKRVEQVSLSDANRPETRYYLTGDNAGASNDSRYFGWVEPKWLRGRADRTLLNYADGQIDISRSGRIAPR